MKSQRNYLQVNSLEHITKMFLYTAQLQGEPKFIGLLYSSAEDKDT